MFGAGIEDEDINEDEVMKQDEATKACKHEKSEKRDVVDDINAKDKHKKPKKKEGVNSSSSTYLDRQSSTKTEAVLRYVDLPILKRFVQFVTPLSNPGSEKPEEKDVMIDVHPEGEHDKEKTAEQDEVLTHWEDAKEEGSRGTDIKIVLEVEMKTSEDEAEEKVDDDDLGEDDREYFIKGDGFKDNSEDTADEEMMKQDEGIKTQEISKKESKGQEGGREDTVEVDKDETDEEDMTKKVE